MDPGIAAELRRLRQARHETGQQVAAALGWSQSKITRIEHCQFGINVRDLRALLLHYKVPADKGRQMVARHQAVASVWHAEQTSDPLCGAAAACGVLEWAPFTVPRLLQTPAYARAVLKSAQQITLMDPGAIRDAVEAVTRWQDQAQVFRCVVDEAVLYRLVGTSEMMISQLGRLANPPPGAQVRILPSDSSVPVLPAGFTHLTFPETNGIAAPDTVLLGLLHETVRLTNTKTVFRYEMAFDRLWDAGADPAEPVKRALEGWEQ